MREEEGTMSEAMTMTVNKEGDLDDLLSRLMISSDPEVMADPSPLWKRLGEKGPVYYHGSSYLINTHRAIRKVILNKDVGINTFAVGTRAEATRAALPPEGKVAFDEVSAFEAMYMSRNTGEPHDRLRRIAQRTFTQQRIRLIQQVIKTTTARYLTQLAQQGPVVDFMQFAYRLPLKIIGDLLAIPEQDLDKVHAWSGKLGRNRGGTEFEPLMEAHQAMKEFRAYVEGIMAGLRERPRSTDDIDLLGDLMDANRGESLSDAELVAMFVVLLFAGHETTTNLIGTGLLALLQSGQWTVLRDRLELLPRAIEELLRFVSPVQWFGRNIVTPIEVEGHRLEAGAVAILMFACANRDPEVFASPDILDVSRENSASHLAFGMGSHVCLGAHLARMEAIEAFSLLARRFPDVRLATDRFVWQGNAMLRSLAALPVELGAERL
jgi:cytochrome P450